MRTLVLGVLVMLHASRGLATAWSPLLQSAAGGPGLGRIYNGAPTIAYPEVAGLVIVNGDGSVGLCSGTVITSTVIVTAAHCLDRFPVRVIAAVFPSGPAEQDYEGAAYLLHPDYARGRLAYADIALLRLAQSVVGITPMPVASVAPRPRRLGTIVGFGQDAAGVIGLKEFGSVKLKRCPAVFRPAGLVRDQLASSLCWRPRATGQDTCHGDSGGPLIVDGALAGVTSGGYPDCPGRWSWDTNVAMFRPWIEAQL